MRSPNCDDRPNDCEPDLIIVHGISLPPRIYGGPYIDQLFTNCLESREHPYFDEVRDMRVSSHLLVRRDGEIVQYVPFHRRAWHAGHSTYDGRDCCNDFSIGIELEGSDDEAYAGDQYSRLADIVLTLCSAYPLLDSKRIAGHSDIAPGRKTDPGPAFDWARLYRLMAVDGMKNGISRKTEGTVTP